LQLTLTSPEITCDHCIATIQRTVDGLDGATFLHGDPLTKQFAVDLASGALLDALGQALADEGYPLGDANAPTISAGGHGTDPNWHPLYRVTKTALGADVNYACPCSCEAGFALDRSQSEQSPESCCCGRQILVGADAEHRLREVLEEPAAFSFDLQTVEMPWGQPLSVALAVPRDGAEHGANEPGH
jgi:copper chaperone CopZ